MARVRGRLYGFGRYPGMRLEAGRGEWVVGEIYQLRDVERVLTILDRYEGVRFARIITTSVDESGRRQRCWVYQYVGPVEERQRILSGDWLANQSL